MNSAALRYEDGVETSCGAIIRVNRPHYARKNLDVKIYQSDLKHHLCDDE